MSVEDSSQKSKLDHIVRDMVGRGYHSPRNPAYNFTLEELDMLASVSGKEKKALLKELKKKHENIKKVVD